jgi:Glycosyl hydrolases family 2, TIM barrel domain/Glycosyl hydrolases family 2, sugar binding domain
MQSSHAPLTSADVDAHGRGYPRPQLRRASWVSLNGLWEFAVDRHAAWRHPREVSWNARIQVPFSPETAQSGIGDTSFLRACWYSTPLVLPTIAEGDRILLHFGAVDYAATVWIDGRCLGGHEGGYTPFTFDITGCSDQSPVELVVRAEDDPQDLAKPRGKQDWQVAPHSIWYPRTTGIWQSVWMEVVPGIAIENLRWTANIERWEVGLECRLSGPERDGLRLHTRLTVGDHLIADDTYSVVNGEVHRRIALSDPGIDDYRNELLWYPESPTLIHASVELWADRGQLVDTVASYTALRSVGTQRDRFVLNNRPYRQRLVLDQGYWPESGMTAPDDEALRRDVELAKAMGFNGVRKHQKLEDPRYLYWADVLGLLVWAEMPSAYRFTQQSVQRVTREWTAAIARDASHPCVVAWVPVNESWGVPNLPDNPAERHYVRALYHLTHTLDPTRPVIGNDGWESVATDIIGIHDYDPDPERLARRYHADEGLPRLFSRERPGGRLLVLEGERHSELPIVLSECGGIALSTQTGAWGYTRATTAEELGELYRRLMSALDSIGLVSGFCYTQFADTYQETNGLLDAYRRSKIPLEQIAAATRGVRRVGDVNAPPLVAAVDAPAPGGGDGLIDSADVDALNAEIVDINAANRTRRD